MRFWRDKTRRTREAHHPDGKFLIREMHKLTTMRMSDFIAKAARSHDSTEYERFQIIHSLEVALSNAEPYLTDDTPSR